MASTTTYDPTTLAFLADQAQGAPGKKHYNPVPRSRIPSTPRAFSRAMRARTSPPNTALTSPSLPPDPLYLLGVPQGQEFVIAQKLRTFSAASLVMVPMNAAHEPLMPGSIFVAIPDAAYYDTVTRIQREHWGWLSQTPIDPNTLRPFLPYADQIHQPYASLSGADSWGPDHPLRAVLQAFWHAHGWHGTLADADHWALHDAQGQPIVSDLADTFWRDVLADWHAQRSVSQILQRHRAQLQGGTYALTLDTPRASRQDWLGSWCGMPAVVPATAHRDIKPRQSTVWGTLVAVDGPRWVFDLRHPDLLTHRVRYRVPFQDAVRLPGRWAAILVPDAAESDPERVQRHIRRASQSLGWPEPWLPVRAEDPGTLLRTLLTPTAIRFDKAQQIVYCTVPADRKVWVPTVQRWLPDWVIVES